MIKKNMCGLPTVLRAIIPSIIIITIIIIGIAIIMSPWSWRRSPRRFRVYTNLGQVVPRAVPATNQMIDKIPSVQKIL